MGTKRTVGVVGLDADDVAGGVGPLADFVEIGAAQLGGGGAHFGEAAHGGQRRPGVSW